MKTTTKTAAKKVTKKAQEKIDNIVTICNTVDANNTTQRNSKMAKNTKANTKTSSTTANKGESKMKTTAKATPAKKATKTAAKVEKKPSKRSVSIAIFDSHLPKLLKKELSERDFRQMCLKEICERTDSKIPGAAAMYNVAKKKAVADNRCPDFSRSAKAAARAALAEKVEETA